MQYSAIGENSIFYRDCHPIHRDFTYKTHTPKHTCTHTHTHTRKNTGLFVCGAFAILGPNAQETAVAATVDVVVAAAAVVRFRDTGTSVVLRTVVADVAVGAGLNAGAAADDVVAGRVIFQQFSLRLELGHRRVHHRLLYIYQKNKHTHNQPFSEGALFPLPLVALCNTKGQCQIFRTLCAAAHPLL